MATVRDRSGQTYKAPVFLVSKRERYCDFGKLITRYVQDGDDVRGKIKIEMLKSKSKVEH